MALAPEIAKLLQPQIDQDLHQQFGIIPQDVYSQMLERSKSDPSVKALGDIAKGMRAGPILAGASELARMRGGSAVNLNPLLAWASGLPGANKEQLNAVMKANPYRSPAQTIGNIMGLADAASQAEKRHIDARDKFMSQQGVGSGRMSPITAMLLRDMLKDEDTKDRWAREDAKDAAKRAQDLEAFQRDLDLKEQQEAYKVFREWKDDVAKKGYPRIAKSAETMFGAFKSKPDSLYVDVPIINYKLSRKSFPQWAQSTEAREFFAALQGFINPILKGDIGSQQTFQEARRFDKALSSGAFSDFTQLAKSYNDIIDSMINDYESSLVKLKATPKQGAYKLWSLEEAPRFNYGSQLRQYKLDVGAINKKLAESSGKSSTTKSTPVSKPPANTKGATDAATQFLDDFIRGN